MLLLSKRRKMETQLQSCYLTKKGPSLVTLFGYSTKSVPGLEINGLGKYGKFIKEKIVFITRSRGLQIPLKRFVLNVEISDDLGDLESSSVKWLEYPLLLHYWFSPVSFLFPNWIIVLPLALSHPVVLLKSQFLKISLNFARDKISTLFLQLMRSKVQWAL